MRLASRIPRVASHTTLHTVSLHTASDVATVSAGTKGHCRSSRARTKNASAPREISSSPHFRAGPVYQNRAAHPIIVSTAGNGYNHILNGNRSAGQRRCSNITPTACPINCTKRRIARIAAITVSKRNKMLKRNASPPSTSNETWGKCLVGCNLPNTEKKFPSSAAEYGTREYPSSSEKIDASAIHKTIQVTKCAAKGPKSRSTKVL